MVIEISRITRHGKRVRFYSTVDLVILDEFGELPFSQVVGGLLFHLFSELGELTVFIALRDFTAAPLIDFAPRICHQKLKSSRFFQMRTRSGSGLIWFDPNNLWCKGQRPFREHINDHESS